MELKKGRKLNNRYEIIKVLKAGGFGITYEAKYIDLERKVVIKEYYPSSIVNRDSTDTVIPSSVDIKNYEKGLEDFLKEAKALAKFDTNPNIVNITEHFTANGTAYFVMPFEEGEDLARYLDKHGKMSETEILDVIFPILKALQEIHKIGMIHRDIKPANIFMRTNKTPLLIDFGTARYAFGKNSKSLTSILTAGYAPIEQYDSKSLQGAFTDIYALGATIYTMATYSVPPESTSRSLAKLRNSADPLKPITSSNFSLEFKNAVHKALNVMEEDRYQSVDEFRKALKGISDGGDKKNNNENRNRLLFIFSMILFIGGMSLFNFLKEDKHNEVIETNVSVTEENITDANVSEAEENTTQSPIDVNVSEAEDYYNRENSHLDLKEYNKAIEVYQKAIEINPQNDEAYFNMGNAYFILLEYDKAMEAYQKAIDINPQRYGAYINLFDLQLINGQDFSFEEQFLSHFGEDKEAMMKYEILKILRSIATDKHYALTAKSWSEKYHGVRLNTWDWNDLDKWIADISDGDRKEKLVEAIEVFKAH